MSEKVSAFFELIADSSVFDAAFSKAKQQATEFAGAFKATSTSVSADADRMGLALQRSIATGETSRATANAQIASRLQFYGQQGGGQTERSGGLSLSGGLMGVYAGLGVVGALTGVGAILAQQVSQYAEYSAAILRNSEAIGINRQELQTWQQIAKVTGLDAQSMVLDFERFSKNLAEGAPTLKLAGVTLQELGITSTSAGTAILQLADYFHTHSDQAQKAAISQALFGRSGTELIPILDQGSQAMKNYQAELQKMGVLLSDTELFAGARAQVALQQFGDAFEAAKSRLIGAALPGFTAFFQQITTIIENNMPLWQQLGQTVGEAVMFIAGVVAGLAGGSLDLAGPANNAGAAYQGLAGTANDAAAGVDNLAGSTKAATDVIADQIAALQDQKRAQDDLYNAQKQSLQDQLDSLKDVVDTRRRSGEDIVSYERRLHELSLNDQIKAVDKQKTNYDRSVDDHIAALQREQQAVKETAGVMGSSLSSGISAGMNAGVNASSSAISAINKQWFANGQAIGKEVTKWFDDMKKDGALISAVRELGRILGSSLLQGAEDQVKADLAGWLGGSSADRNAAGVSPHRLPHRASGGFVTEGPYYLHDNELVLPLNNRGRTMDLLAQSGLGGGGAGIVVNFNGPVADELVANRVISAIEKKARQRGLALPGGFG